MAREVVERYRRWFEYEHMAHAKVLSSLNTVPTERRNTSAYLNAVALFAHIVAGRWLWLHRFGSAGEPSRPLFADNAGLEEVATQWQSVRVQWVDYLAHANDNELDREIEYQSLDAGRFRNRVEDIMAELIGHSWYHRGQIELLVRAAGGQPAETDLVFWCRVPVPADSA